MTPSFAQYLKTFGFGLFTVLGLPSCQHRTPLADSARQGSTSGQSLARLSRYAEPSARNPITRCTEVAAASLPSLIDDFEQTAKPNLWFVFTDGTRGATLHRETVAVDGQQRALHVTADGFHNWGSVLVLPLGPLTTARRPCEIDASKYAGIRLRARGHGSPRVVLATTPQVPVARGGGCNLGQDCFDLPGAELHLHDDWATFELRFCEMFTVGWGQRFATVDPQRLYMLQIQLAANQQHDMWLEDVAFLPHSPELDRKRCGPPCPLQAAPAEAVVEPTLLPQVVADAGLTLNTFEQSTKSCGPLTRRYLTYVPKHLARNSSAPVLIALHGSGASAESFRHYQTHARFEALSERDGFILVYANAAPGPNTIALLPNSGAWYAEPSPADEVDDFAYLQAIRKDLQARQVIDGTNKIFLVGQSNGGGMVNEAARRSPEVYSGFAAMMPYVGQSPASPVLAKNARLSRVLFAYSQADPGLPKGYAKTLNKLANSWAAALGISTSVIAAPTRVALPDRVDEGSNYAGTFANAVATRHSQVVQLDLRDANNTVALRILEFDHAGHMWPNPTQDSMNLLVEKWGLRNQDIDAADVIWQFFRGE